ncbi:Amino oxidase and/or NAD binding 8 domain containing protein [Asbolus verrucosus]|uniref:Amino oxidase and/or NAD binding 8 domain containing protein n=1 Tax=Asbolus verrucosus TaxID=1661398 RepID=A0A482VRX7_ASBVE|nr:Amino oxidase and/or NAD binding 8 domain containing protein [Asbolus verrucosus]
MKLLKLFLVVFLQIYAATSSLATPSVVIVGAGPAGIAAATRLLESNYKNILILEAENRIGGRINSVFFGEAYIDLGAEWCHGKRDNIVYELVKDFNILRHTEISSTVYHSSKKNVDEEFGKELIQIMESIYVPDGHRDEVEGKSVGQYCIEKYNSTIYEKYQKYPEKLELAKSSTDLFHHIVLSSEGAFSWFEPSAKSDYKDCEGDLNLNWNGLGYKTALEVLMKKFPDPSKRLPLTVLFNKEVVKVLWNDSAEVVCSDKTSFEADHVIFTPSIGVLKQNHERIFSPPLPLSKKKAIRQIGFGAVMKVAMHFNNRWWSKTNFTGFHFIWSEDDKAIVSKEFPEGPLKEGRSWLTELFSIIPVEHNPNVLIGWLTGDMIPQIELMANETLVDGIEFLLNKFVGHKYNITKPDAIIRTFWYSNPHFRGTYSYQTVEARKNNVTAEMELSKPLLNLEGRPIVLFAGEASHPYFYSTVHGAIETGYREADRIINLYK